MSVHETKHNGDNAAQSLGKLHCDMHFHFQMIFAMMPHQTTSMKCRNRSTDSRGVSKRRKGRLLRTYPYRSLRLTQQDVPWVVVAVYDIAIVYRLQTSEDLLGDARVDIQGTQRNRV